jgi:hypothetical protein
MSNQVGTARVWVYGKSEPGWYVACAKPDVSYANEVRAMGYSVAVQPDKPTEVPA